MTFRELFKERPYPGRFIIIGVTGGMPIAVYGATGRSPSSLARRFVEVADGVFMTATDATVAIQGNPDLLEYPAVRIFENGVVVANGNHIDKIEAIEAREVRKQLSYALSEEAYEPDEYRTPRITGMIRADSSGFEAALHIVRSASDGIDKSSWTVPLVEGEGMFLSTYGGMDVKPTPSFSGDPVSVSLPRVAPKLLAQDLYDALTPEGGRSEYRVGFVVISLTRDNEPTLAIVNRHSQ